MKSIKLKNDNYWDSSGITHERTTLDGVIDEMQTDIANVVSGGTGYIKFNDGTMICWGNKSGTTNATTKWDSFYYSGNIDFSNFAQTFIEIPKVSISGNSVAGGYLYLVATSPTSNKVPSTTNAGGFCIIRPSSSSNVPYSVSYIAIGKWK